MIRELHIKLLITAALSAIPCSSVSTANDTPQEPVATAEPATGMLETTLDSLKQEQRLQLKQSISNFLNSRG